LRHAPSWADPCDRPLVLAGMDVLRQNRAVSELLDKAVDRWLSEQGNAENEEAL